mmetsp:Transcript_76719/g.204856  ORF Transcript_76719/g.204856 Transcript_76719/m.204856 type:complete len:281 (-) Transcript_76719:812-1654(-)
MGRVECYASMVSAALACTTLTPLAEFEMPEPVGASSFVGPAAPRDICESSIAGLHRFLDFASAQVVHSCQRHFSKVDAVLFAAHHSQSVNEVSLRRLRDHISEQIVEIDGVMSQLCKEQSKIQWQTNSDSSPVCTVTAGAGGPVGEYSKSVACAGSRIDARTGPGLCAWLSADRDGSRPDTGPGCDMADGGACFDTTGISATLSDSDSMGDYADSVRCSRLAVERIAGQLADLDRQLACCVESAWRGVRDTCGSGRASLIASIAGPVGPKLLLPLCLPGD